MRPLWFRTNRQRVRFHHSAHLHHAKGEPTMPHTSQVLFFGPVQVLEKLKTDGKRKSKLTFDQIVILSLFSGVFIGIGGMLANLTGGNSPTMENENPGLQRFFSAAVFPVGLILTVITGAELFTGNTAILLLGLLSRKWKTKKFFIHYLQFSFNLLLSYIFNMIGAFLVAYFFVFLSQPCCTAYYVTYSQQLAVSKVTKTFGQLVLLGIACNMLVVLAVIVANAASTVEGKILGIWFPIMTFVACGLEHSVTNAFYIPIGMLYGANISVYDFLIGNLLPVTIGNIIGGSIIIACLTYYVYDFRQRNKAFIFEQVVKRWKEIKEAYHKDHSDTLDHIRTI